MARSHRQPNDVTLGLDGLQIGDVPGDDSDDPIHAREVCPTPCETATPNAVPAAASSTPLFVANPYRRGAKLYNNSTEELKLAYGRAATDEDFDEVVPAKAPWTMDVLFVGEVNGIWPSATGNARVVDFQM
jgi:hypothetical protein